MMYTLSSCTCSHPEPLPWPFHSVLRSELKAIHFPSSDQEGRKYPFGFIGSPGMPAAPVRLRYILAVCRSKNLEVRRINEFDS